MDDIHCDFINNQEVQKYDLEELIVIGSSFESLTNRAISINKKKTDPYTLAIQPRFKYG